MPARVSKWSRDAVVGAVGLDVTDRLAQLRDQGLVLLVQVEVHVHVFQGRRQGRDGRQPEVAGQEYAVGTSVERQVDPAFFQHAEELFRLVHLVHPRAQRIGLEHLPAVDEGDAVGLEAVPAVVEGDRGVFGEGDEADPHEAFGHLDEVGVGAAGPAQAGDAQALAVHFAQIGGHQRALGGQADQLQVDADAAEALLRELLQGLAVEGVLLVLTVRVGLSARAALSPNISRRPAIIRARMICSILGAPPAFRSDGRAACLAGCLAEAGGAGDAALGVPVRGVLRPDHARS
jgi:hypothetical protein